MKYIPNLVGDKFLTTATQCVLFGFGESRFKTRSIVAGMHLDFLAVVGLESYGELVCLPTTARDVGRDDGASFRVGFQRHVAQPTRDAALSGGLVTNNQRTRHVVHDLVNERPFLDIGDFLDDGINRVQKWSIELITIHDTDRRETD